MPNGGEHYERLGVCPLCGSPSIRIRRQEHRHLLWRCRNCNRVFRTPNVAEYIIPAGGDGSGYVFAESIPEMERRGRLHERRGAQHSRRRSVSSKVTAVIAIVVLIGAVGFLIFMAGPGRDGSGPDQRPGSDESPVVTDLQAPTPRTTPSATNTPRLSPQLTAQVAQSSMATAIPTETPTATPTMHPSPTPELVPTATNTPTPSPPPTAKAVQASIATAIPTDTPVAIQTKLPTKTPTSTPVPTAVPQISPTPMSTTPSVTVLATFENGRWLIQNRPTLATSIVAIDWIEDGIETSESEAVQELVNLAAFHEMLTASLIDRPWFADGVTATELEGVKYLGYIAHDSEAAARQVAEMPWFVDGITETEVEAIDNLAYIAQSSAAVTELTAGLPWFVDGITETELEGVKYLGYIAHDSEAAARQVAEMPWFVDGITETEVEAIDNLAYIAQSSAAVTELTAGLPWFVDGITETELEGVKYLGYIAHDSEAAARQVAEMPWFVDGITETEVEAIDNLAYIAQSSAAVTELTAGLPWFVDGITETELEGIKYLGYIADDSEAAARQVAEMPWFVDGITETEVEAIDNLAYIAQSSAAVTELTAGLPWFVDGITETELEGIKYLGYIADDNGTAAEQIAKMPFLTAIEPVDVSAMKALADLAAEDAVDQVMARTSLAQGITDGLTPVIAMLYGVAETNPSLTDRLLDPEGVNLERRSITLPLTGDIDLVIVRTAPGAVRGMDLLEHSVRASEELMGKPLPTRYVGLLYEDAVIEGYAGTNFGTHIAILPKYDVDDGSHYAMSALGNIAHEVAHYYWSGNANWIDEGLAEFMTYAIESERTGEPIGVANAPCAYAPSIIELESLAPDPVANHEAFGCNYSLGVRLFVDMYRAMNENAIWERLRDLYNKSLMEDSADDLKVTALNIKHLRQVFHSDPGALVSIGRWYDRTEDYDLSQLDLRQSDPTLPSINGQIDEAYVNIGEDGPSVSSFSVDDVADQTVWLNLDYSYNITGGPHKLVLDLVEFYEDGFEFRRGSVEITAESQYIGGGFSVSVGTDKWASGRYWVYLYDGDRKVADVQYEVTP